MKVITDNQIIVDGKCRTDIDDYYNATGKEKKKGGGLFAKGKEFISSGKAGAVFTALSNPGTTGGTGSYEAPPPPPPAAKKPMSTTTKVLIGVGGALILGGILYFVFKGKKVKAGK